MKKTIIYTSCFIVLLLTAVSCKDKKKKEKDPQQTASASASPGSADTASRVIEYTNLVVDMANSHNAYLKDILGNTEKIESALKNPDDKFGFLRIIHPHLTKFTVNNMNGITIENPVPELGKENQAYFKTQVTQYNAKFEKMNTDYKHLRDYLTAQDYKDDKGAKGYALIDTIRGTVQKLYTEKIVLMKKVNEIADAAEIVVLKDSPLKEYIIAMKTDMKNIRNFVDLLSDNANSYTKISAQAQAGFAALEIAQAKNAGLNMENAKKANKEGNYKNFYDSFHNLLLHTKKTLRNAGENGRLSSSDIEGLDSDYDGLIRNYNYFNQ